MGSEEIPVATPIPDRCGDSIDEHVAPIEAVVVGEVSDDPLQVVLGVTLRQLVENRFMILGIILITLYLFNAFKYNVIVDIVVSYVQ